MMNFLKLNPRAVALLLIVSVVVMTMPARHSFAQNKRPQSPSRTGYVNDFAAVLDSANKQRLENILQNLQQRAGVEFVVATVKSAGDQDIFDYSQQMAQDWNAGASGTRQKSLLLVIAADTGKFFTQASKSVKGDLPDGILGEMGRRMRPQIESQEFSEGLLTGVQTFVNLLAERKGFSLVNIDQAIAASAQATPVETATPAPETKMPASAEAAAAPAVIETPRPAESPTPEANQPASRPRVVVTSTPEPVEVSTPAPTPTPAPAETPAETKAPPPSQPESSPPATVPAKSTGSEPRSTDDEEIDLTQTLPADKRIEALKSFLESHPRSTSRPRAVELIIVARATLGDQRLQAGDVAGGLEQFRQAIAESPAEMSDKLYNDVVSRFPLNLIVRGQRAAAIDSAHAIEALVRLNPKRVLALASFYLAIEDVNEATRLAEFAVKMAPELAAAHQALGSARHIALQLDEAAVEYARALELDPKLSAARRGLADLKRAAGNSQEAAVLYREILQADAKDNAARTGLILALFDLGKKDEAEAELAAALKEDERNVLLLTGVAYWHAAHNQSARALELGQKAVEIEPRYTWAQIAMARGLLEKSPLAAERALRFVRRYGKFPTLDYELATVLAAMGLFDEAVDELSRSFTLKNGEIETKLAGRTPARAAGFMELLARERQASIFQPTAADTVANAKMLKALMAFTAAMNPPAGQTMNEAEVLATGQEFAGGEDAMRTFRQVYVASRLLKKRIAIPTVIELSQAAMQGVEAAVDTPAATTAVQADDLGEIRATAIAVGGTPSVPDAPRSARSALLRGHIEDLIGWSLFNQEKTADAVTHLRLAVGVLPERTPVWREALWHLGTALEAEGKNEQALLYYMKNYVTGLPDPIHRAIIEGLYRKVNGSLDGLDEKIGPSPFAPSAPAATPSPSPSPTSNSESGSIIR